MDFKTMGVVIGGVAMVAGMAYVSRDSESLAESEGGCPKCGSTEGCSCNVVDFRKTVRKSKSPDDIWAKLAKKEEDRLQQISRESELERMEDRPRVVDISDRLESDRYNREIEAERAKKRLRTAANTDQMVRDIEAYNDFARRTSLKYHDSTAPDFATLQSYRSDMATLSMLNRRVQEGIRKLQEARNRWELPNDPEAAYDKEDSIDVAADLASDVHFLVQTLAAERFFERRGSRLAPMVDDQGRNVDELIHQEAIATATSAANLAGLAAHLHRGRQLSGGGYSDELDSYDRRKRVAMERLRDIMLDRAEVSRRTPIGGRPRVR